MFLGFSQVSSVTDIIIIIINQTASSFRTELLMETFHYWPHGGDKHLKEELLEKDPATF